MHVARPKTYQFSKWNVGQRPSSIRGPMFLQVCNTFLRNFAKLFTTIWHVWLGFFAYINIRKTADIAGHW